ncbi:unnamed protein product [Cuscuta campestris]|uniref:DRBM domain-containing protein n=1 Tax=Cuscuta campestris TaxID=132261 RepID=A0A484KGA2_9ASTE|nr:unnamed protein product [Cuscuta campestris]
MFKTKLQELCQRLALPLPEYTATMEGPPHEPKFNATVTVNGLPFHATPSKCRTSREAQNLAASFAYEYFSANPPEVSLTPSRSSPSDPAPARLPDHIAFDQGQTLPADSQLVCSPQPPHHSSHPQISTDPLSGTQNVQSHLPQETITNDPSYLTQNELLDGPQPHSPAPQQALIYNHSSATAEEISTALVDTPQPHTPLRQQTQNQSHSSPQGISTGGRVLYKSKLQELCRMRAWKPPEYTTVKEGPDHRPQFTSTVIVNGVPFKTPHNQSRSSKEATSLAACVALEHLTGVKTVSQEGLFPSSADNTDGVQNNERNEQTPDFSSTPLAGRETYKSSDVLHIYKNRLQQYAQKQGMTLPYYSTETEGPPHERLFRSKVAIAGNIYESPQYFRTLKEAEQAAAKVALEALSPVEIQKGGGLYKTLLQQLAQKLGHLFPVYKTIQCGPPHAASFISTVQVGEETFQGHEAKSKKQAEMNAAEVAYNTLIDCSNICTKRQKTSTSPGTHISCLPTPHGVSLCQ